MRCPVCSGRSLSVEVSFRGMVPCTFGSDDVQLLDGTALDSEWNESSRCECLICGWQGTLGETQGRLSAGTAPAGACEPAGPASHPGRGGSVNLDEIRELLTQAPCPRLWQPRIEALVKEVERLRAVIDAMARISTPRRRRAADGSDEDTVVG